MSWLYIMLLCGKGEGGNIEIKFLIYFPPWINLCGNKNNLKLSNIVFFHTIPCNLLLWFVAQNDLWRFIMKVQDFKPQVGGMTQTNSSPLYSKYSYSLCLNTEGMYGNPVCRTCSSCSEDGKVVCRCWIIIVSRVVFALLKSSIESE